MTRDRATSQVGLQASSLRTIVPGTLRALATVRRAIPLATVGLALISAEWIATQSWPSVAIDLLLLAGFCLVAPAAWRWLCSPDRGTWDGILSYVAYLVVGTVTAGVLGVALPRALALDWTYVVEPSSFGVVLVLFLVGGWGLGRDIDLEAGIEAERQRAEKLALEAERAQLLALRAQLDPHFLFNTLNAIAEWCREDPIVAEAATLKLASMLRTILDGIHQPSWPLSSELSLARSLFDLYQVRDPERYVLVADVPEPVPEARVAPMLLLPLFENALTHGPSAGHTGAVELRVREAQDGVQIEIRNPGRYTGRREGGQGIGMVERRLALAYGGDASLELRADGQGTVAVLSLPRLPATEEKMS